MIKKCGPMDSEPIIDLTGEEPLRTILKPLSKVPKSTSSGISFSNVNIFLFPSKNGEEYDMEYRHKSSSTMSVDEYERSKETKVKPSAVIASVLRGKKKREKRQKRRSKRKRRCNSATKLKRLTTNKSNEDLKIDNDLQIKNRNLGSKNYLAGYFDKYIEIFKNDTGYRLRNHTGELLGISQFSQCSKNHFPSCSLEEKPDLKEKLLSHKHTNSTVMIQ